MLKNGDKAKVTGKPTLPPRPMFGKAGEAAPTKSAKADVSAIAKSEKKAAAKPAKAKVDPKPKPIKAAKPVKPAKADKPVKPKADPKPKAAKEAGAPTKRSLAIGLLGRKEGTTLREILDTTGWPAVSVPEIAKAGKMNLRKEKVKGENTRYFGTPITG